jgi:hypothetical protein
MSLVEMPLRGIKDAIALAIDLVEQKLRQFSRAPRSRQ